RLEKVFALELTGPVNLAGRGIEGGEAFLAAVQNVKAPFVEQRRGHVARDLAVVERRPGLRGILGVLHVALPREGGVRELALAAEFHRIDRRILRAAGERDARPGDRR